MPIFVRKHIGVDERAALRTVLGLQVLIEAQIDVHRLVGRAVERAHAASGRAAGRLGAIRVPDRRRGGVARPQ